MSDVVQGGRELAEFDFDDNPDPSIYSGRSRGRGPMVTISVVIALVIATGLTVLGLGVTNTAVTNYDANSWLFSSRRGEVDRVNGITDKVDTRARLKDAQNHSIQVTQTDKYLILRDLDTGQVSTLDLTTLQVSAVMATTPGLGVSVALRGEDAFVIDSVQGQVRQLDPRSLAPIGDSISMPNGIAPGGFDGGGTLWIAVPTEGTVVAIAPGHGGAGPKVLRTVPVAPPGHDLVVSALDEGVAVLDNTDQVLDTVHGSKTAATQVPISNPGTMPARSAGTAVPVTVSDDRKVVVVDRGRLTQFIVPGVGALVPAVAFAGHVYCADAKAGIVYEFDGSGKLVNQIHIPSGGGQLELEVREDHLFINAPDGSTATVVDHNHVAHQVNKYEQGVLGGDPPPVDQPPQDPKPVKTVPGRPQDVTASAGNASVRIAWRKARDNGAPITKYVVTGAGQTVTVGANQRTADIRGLVNGTSYQFKVHAVNAVGAGPDAVSPAVTPTSEVPDAPTSVTATAQPDGTVVVTWPAANGEGHKIVRYSVTSVTGGAQAPVGDVKNTTMTISAGTLPYGTQVAFTVISVNDKGGGSAPSPVSNTVVPFNVPGAPVQLNAVTVTDRKGTIAVSWQPAPSNGRPIDKYVVTAGAVTQDVTTGTSVTIGGFADDTAVPVTVHAVNAAGAGPDAATAARTIGVPTLTVTASSSGYNNVSVTFTPNNKGGTAVCKVQIAGAGATQTGCTTQPMTLTVTKLWPNQTYSFTVSVTTAAGAVSSTGTRATVQLRATVLCGDLTYCGSGIYIYATPNNGNPTSALGRFKAGNQFIPHCHVVSDIVDARPGGRQSNQWLQLTYTGRTAYFPFAWVNTDGGNNLNLLPVC